MVAVEPVEMTLAAAAGKLLAVVADNISAERPNVVEIGLQPAPGLMASLLQTR